MEASIPDDRENGASHIRRERRADCRGKRKTHRSQSSASFPLLTLPYPDHLRGEHLILPDIDSIDLVASRELVQRLHYAIRHLVLNIPRYLRFLSILTLQASDIVRPGVRFSHPRHIDQPMKSLPGIAEYRIDVLQPMIR